MAIAELRPALVLAGWSDLADWWWLALTVSAGVIVWIVITRGTRMGIQVISYSRRAKKAHRKGDAPAANLALQRALAIAADPGFTDAAPLSAAAQAAGELGEAVWAVFMSEKALAAMQGRRIIGRRQLELVLHVNAALAYRKIGRPDGVLTHCTAAVAFESHVRQKDAPLVRSAETLMAFAKQYIGDYRGAVAYSLELAAKYRSLNPPDLRRSAYMTASAGSAMLMLGDLDQAVRLAQEAAATAGSAPDGSGNDAGAILVDLAGIKLLQGDIEGAAATSADFETWCRATGAPDWLTAQIPRLHAEIAWRRDDFFTELALRRVALEQFAKTDISHEPVGIRMLAELAACQWRTGDIAGAASLARRTAEWPRGVALIFGRTMADLARVMACRRDAQAVLSSWLTSICGDPFLPCHAGVHDGSLRCYIREELLAWGFRDAVGSGDALAATIASTA